MMIEDVEDYLPRHKAGLSLEHNQHKNIYDTPQQWIEDNTWCDWESEDAKKQAIALDSIWTLQWYPDTPVGFYALAGPTLGEVLRRANQLDREHWG